MSAMSAMSEMSAGTGDDSQAPPLPDLALNVIEYLDRGWGLLLQICAHRGFGSVQAGDAAFDRSLHWARLRSGLDIDYDRLAEAGQTVMEQEGQPCEDFEVRWPRYLLFRARASDIAEDKDAPELWVFAVDDNETINKGIMETIAETLKRTSVQNALILSWKGENAHARPIIASLASNPDWDIHVDVLCYEDLVHVEKAVDSPVVAYQVEDNQGVADVKERFLLESVDKMPRFIYGEDPCVKIHGWKRGDVIKCIRHYGPCPDVQWRLVV